MLARSGPIPTRGQWAFEVKWDGFRALVRTGAGFRVRSRRGWDMTKLVPELETLPPGLILDGEIASFVDGVPYFPAVCARLLHRVRDVELAYVIFDVLPTGRSCSSACDTSSATAARGAPVLAGARLRRRRPNAVRRSVRAGLERIVAKGLRG